MKKYENSFPDTRNHQVEQQGILIGILSTRYSITIAQPKKKSVVAKPFLKILKIQNNSEIYEVDNFVLNKVKETFNNDIANGVSSKTATRRFEVNKITEQLHFLIDLVKRNGYNPYSIDIGKKRVREDLTELQCDQIVWNEHDIKIIGSKINEVIVHERLVESKLNYCTIEKGDLEIMSILLN